MIHSKSPCIYKHIYWPRKAFWLDPNFPSRESTTRIYELYHVADPLNDTAMQEVVQSNVRNQARRNIGPMLPETEKLLHAFYQPFVRRLAAMLEDRRFLWPEVQPPA